jgi:hypothetical protein
MHAEEADHQFQKVPPADTEKNLDKLRRIFEKRPRRLKPQRAQAIRIARIV